MIPIQNQNFASSRMPVRQNQRTVNLLSGQICCTGPIVDVSYVRSAYCVASKSPVRLGLGQSRNGLIRCTQGFNLSVSVHQPGAVTYNLRVVSTVSYATIFFQNIGLDNAFLFSKRHVWSLSEY